MSLGCDAQTNAMDLTLQRHAMTVRESATIPPEDKAQFQTVVDHIRLLPSGQLWGSSIGRLWHLL